MIKELTILLPVEYVFFEKTIDFYSDVFCLKATRGVSELGNPFCSFNGLGVEMVVHTAKPGEFPYPEFRPTGHGLALSFEVLDFGATISRLETNQVPILNQWNYEDGTVGISVEDPAGNRIELWGH